ncbi:transcriptional regulator [Nocardia seriolae]|uniref:winged helix-turn-helix transcriptional regulator n=1 Tax=Nocardia seriolae TaxID=37332 RepID=UPI00051A71F5|nr:helix-turn-helix domain-containing protein [Nocardia seriolae]GEM26747.1 transcriptional regulator [Nocardia seriolae NBRC 15557]MTJ66915.1 transcriptional regulator [Nocardia seriolae]MTJ74256.1 transcriptional regulator [Nocardia seriolae]MTJ84897.1 transcriptional regulator [Nocardia seriolae]MTK28893.1 transcriptional regulator [Nocardia seriolae]
MPSVTNTADTEQAAGAVPTGPCGDDHCGIRDTLDRIGDKWTVQVLVELRKGVRRFGELHRALPGISQRMLTITTKRLLRDGFLERTAYPTIPPQVEYRLSESGESLAEVAFYLADWSRAHMAGVAAARARWDAEHGGLD